MKKSIMAGIIAFIWVTTIIGALCFTPKNMLGAFLTSTLVFGPIFYFLAYTLTEMIEKDKDNL